MAMAVLARRERTMPGVMTTVAPAESIAALNSAVKFGSGVPGA